MVDYSREEAAERAGIDPEDLDRLVELGVIEPSDEDRFTTGEIRKAGLLESLRAAGLPLEAMATELRTGRASLDFVSTAAYERFSGLTDKTFSELGRQTDVPVELLTVIREAAGGSEPSPDDRVRDGELPIFPFVELAFREGFRPAVIEGFLRSVGDSLRRMADAEEEWWRSEVQQQREKAGWTATEIANDPVSAAIPPLLEQAVLAMYRSQQTYSWTGAIIEDFEARLAESGVYGHLDKPPAMCFFDITGYTRLTQERGDAAAAQLAADLSRLTHRASVQHGGRPVKWLGDGVMFYFRDPGPGVVAALDMAEGVHAAGFPPAHVGLHAGPIVQRDGDYYGQTVNIASRIAEYARPGEVLVSQAVVDASAGTDARFTDVGPVELKGIAGAVHLHSAHRA